MGTWISADMIVKVVATSPFGSLNIISEMQCKWLICQNQNFSTKNRAITDFKINKRPVEGAASLCEVPLQHLPGRLRVPECVQWVGLLVLLHLRILKNFKELFERFLTSQATAKRVSMGQGHIMMAISFRRWMISFCFISRGAHKLVPFFEVWSGLIKISGFLFIEFKYLFLFF